MSMTMTQKILAAHAGLQEVKAGDLIEAKLDLVLGNDITAPVAIRVFEQTGFKTVFDPERIAIVLDHYTPCKDIKSAELCQISRNFARKHGILHFYDVGQAGIEHALLPEKGLVAPGECVIGADSHTCTYGALGAFSTGVGSTDMAAGIAAGENWFKVPAAIKVTLEGSLPKHVSGKDVILHLIGMIGVDGALYRSLEFTGDGVSSLSMDDRFTISNMAIEAGAKNGIFPVDEKTLAYVSCRVSRSYTVYEADPDAVYEREVVIDLSALRPTVSMPHLPSNTKTIDQVKGLPIDQVVIGSCTNGRISDRAHLRSARCRGCSQRPRRRSRCPLHCHSRHPGHQFAMPPGGSHRNLSGSRLRLLHADLRSLPGRTYGLHGCGRTRRLHHQPQLRRPDGPHRERSDSRVSRSCRSQRRCRLPRRPGRL